MTGLYGTTDGKWHLYPEWDGDYEIVGPMIRMNDIKYGPKSRPFVATANNEHNARAIAQVPGMLALVERVLLTANNPSQDDALDDIESLASMARAIARELEEG